MEMADTLCVLGSNCRSQPQLAETRRQLADKERALARAREECEEYKRQALQEKRLREAAENQVGHESCSH